MSILQVFKSINILQFKMGYACIDAKKIKRLTEVSRFVYEIGNMVPPDSQPFVGLSAFAHKGGVHIDAVGKNTETANEGETVIMPANIPHALNAKKRFKMQLIMIKEKKQ